MSSQVMLVTGGGRGIGAATAVMAARRGFDVAISYVRDEAAADAVVRACRDAGRRAIAVRSDVTIEDDVMSLFRETREQLGAITAVVNNAGTLDTACRLDEMSVERVRRIVDVNLIGAFVVLREAVRAMSTAHGGRGGSIVNVSSAASYLGSPGEFIDYAATKGALDTMTIGLAKEVAAEHVRVNAVRPGLIETDIHALAGLPDRVADLAPNVPMGRGGTADEVAEAIMWLASDAASYVTGTFVNCAGGR